MPHLLEAPAPRLEAVHWAGPAAHRFFSHKYMPEGAQREDVPVRRRFYLALPGLSEAQKVIMSWPDGERPPPSARQCTCSCCWGGQAMSWHHDGAIAVGCSCQSNKFGIPHCLV